MYLQKMNSDTIVKEQGAYSHAVKIGDFVYISMQLGLNKDGVMQEGVENQAKQVMDNIRMVLAENGLSMHHIVKTSVYLKDINDSKVVNDIYENAFDDTYVLPARSTMAVADLPKNALVAVDCLVIDTLNLEAQMENGCSSCSGGCDGNCGH